MSKKQKLNDEDHVQLLDTVTYKFHEIIVEFLNALTNEINDSAKADDILVNALAINLGNYIGQLDAKDQHKYAAMSRAIIREYTLMGTINKDIQDFGQVGRG